MFETFTKLFRKTCQRCWVKATASDAQRVALNSFASSYDAADTYVCEMACSPSADFPFMMMKKTRCITAVMSANRDIISKK